MIFNPRRRRIPAKSPSDLEAMEAAGRVVGVALQEVRKAAEPGRTTADLDRVAEDVIRSYGAVPTFLGYQGFPASICASVNLSLIHISEPTRRS